MSQARQPMRPAPESLKKAIREAMKKTRGVLYHAIPHPDFASWPASHGNERQDIIKPHLDHPGGTVLDIGAHFGTFAHWLEDLGYQVTAVEHSPKYAAIAREVRDICGKTFEIFQGSIFDLPAHRFDLVFALNIFHHFLKSEAAFTNMERFLGRLECDVMFFQSHTPEEEQMRDAYRNFDQDEFAAYVAKAARLPEIVKIGNVRRRNLYKLSRRKSAHGID